MAFAPGEEAQVDLSHYGVVADPTRVRDPNRKGTVEHAIGHTQATALKGKRFEFLEEQNAFLEHWETKWAAPRIHGSTRRQVEAMYQEERPYLKALPVANVQYFKEAQRTVCDDTCIRVDHSRYAARPALIGSRVLVRLFEQACQRALHEGFHTKMEMLSRRAYGFRNFENYRMRVLAQCGWNGVINRV